MAAHGKAGKKKAAKEAEKKAHELERLKREVSLAARAALEVIAARARLVREQKERAERKRERETARFVVLLARYGAELAGWPPSFADHMLAHGMTDVEVGDILKASRPIV